MLRDVQEGRGGGSWEKEEEAGWTVGGGGRGMWVERKGEGSGNMGKVEGTAGGDVEEFGEE